MTFEEVVAELAARAGSTVAIDIRPVGSPRDVFGVLDGIDRVWGDESGTTYVVLQEAEAAVTLRPSDFVEAELGSAETPGGIETTLRVRAGAVDIRFAFTGT